MYYETSLKPSFYVTTVGQVKHNCICMYILQPSHIKNYMYVLIYLSLAPKIICVLKENYVKTFMVKSTAAYG